ncbi:MAG: ABC transporter substrate-binding protein, partial [Xanthobacteraceae bacterium]
PPAARADEKITYLFPAPPILPAFGPIQIAKGKGYFSQAGLDVYYAVGRGGVDVAKEVGAGNVPLGGIVADGPIVVRHESPVGLERAHLITHLPLEGGGRERSEREGVNTIAPSSNTLS